MVFYVKVQLVGESIPLITLNVQRRFMQFILNIFGTHGKAEVPTLYMATGAQLSLCAKAVQLLGVSTSQAQHLFFFFLNRHCGRKGRKLIINVTF